MVQQAKKTFETFSSLAQGSFYVTGYDKGLMTHG